ncbi:MAG: aminotransferase class V-fold PLP-dependent enzyme [Balneolaceae bacterium]|nr:aminotransferase class V-fold PLP-dependent enzyme [Balneolaceae bacterium]MCH8548901.1 aminotransferase class V-fold PLP-dependent enzyme [Balneolaceae bacterium]
MSESPFSEDELNHLRNLFPHIGNGHVYLNHAAISPLSTRVVEAINSFITERHEGSIENFEGGMEILSSARKLAANYLDVPQNDHITFLGNTSDAISAVAEGFPWGAGDEVLLNTMEFPSNVHPFRALQPRGVKVVMTETPGHRITAEHLESKITPRTRLLSVSAVQFLSGFRADLEEIGELCRAHDIFFMVDGIQQLGAMPIKPQEAGIDVIASGSHKWLMGPMGCGILWLSERMAELLKPAKTGWLSVEEPWDMLNYDQPWLPVSQHLETGTPNMLGITGLKASMETLLEIGSKRIGQQINHLTNHAISQLTEKGAELITPTEEKSRAGIVTFIIPGISNPEETVNLLKQIKITISAREGMIRISPHFYNSTEEIDHAIEALTK